MCQCVNARLDPVHVLLDPVHVLKPKKLALVACMRKLLVILNTMAKTNEPWRYADSAQVGK